LATLCFFILLLILSFLLTGWVLAVVARAVGSARASLRIGLLGTLLIRIINIVLFAAGTALNMHKVLPETAVNGVVLLLGIGLIFIMLRRLFRLSFWRTCVLYGASVALTLIQIGLAVTVVRPFLVEAFVLSDRSMAPTIRPNDLFVANKLLHPHRRDLVVYRSGDSRHILECRRLIGLPGDHLRFKNGELEINGQRATAPAAITEHGHASPVGLPPKQARYHDGQSLVLGSDEYFLIGDNLGVAVDSRIEGPVSRSSLIGVVDLIYWPPDRFRILR
jgi:signal peptidase I